MIRDAAERVQRLLGAVDDGLGSFGYTSRVRRAASLVELRRMARIRAPKAVFDYVDGAAEREVSLRSSRSSWDRVEFHPRVLRDVAEVDTSVTVLGRRYKQPFGLGPTGFTRLMHTEGEIAVARAAAGLGVPYALSTVGTTTPEELAASGAITEPWFQLYLWRDRGASRELVERAREAGFYALILTLDMPVAGNRLRDARNGLAIPPAATWSALAEGALHPMWWIDALASDPVRFATLSSQGGGAAEIANRMFDPSITLEDVEWLRGLWAGPIVVKGALGIDDVELLAAVGVDAVVLSNHGGRQLDRSPLPLSLLRPVLDAVGDRMEVLLDGGVMSGADAVAGVALGARMVLVGRAYLYGLMAGGSVGVERALALLAAETRRTMQLLGARSVAELEGMASFEPAALP